MYGYDAATGDAPTGASYFYKRAQHIFVMIIQRKNVLSIDKHMFGCYNRSIGEAAGTCANTLRSRRSLFMSP